MALINMWAEMAAKAVDADRKAVRGLKEMAMAGPVAEAIKDFSRQNETFAKAVAQGGRFSDCLKAVAKGTGNYISDLDAYKKAVEFYLPEAKVQMQLSIALADTEDPAAGGMILTMDDLM